MTDIDIDLTAVRAVARQWDALADPVYFGLWNRTRDISVDPESWPPNLATTYGRLRMGMDAAASDAWVEMNRMANALSAACDHYEQTDEQSAYEFDERVRPSASRGAGA